VCRLCTPSQSRTDPIEASVSSAVPAPTTTRAGKCRARGAAFVRISALGSTGKNGIPVLPKSSRVKYAPCPKHISDDVIRLQSALARSRSRTSAGYPADTDGNSPPDENASVEYFGLAHCV